MMLELPGAPQQSRRQPTHSGRWAPGASAGASRPAARRPRPGPSPPLPEPPGTARPAPPGPPVPPSGGGGRSAGARSRHIAPGPAARRRPARESRAQRSSGLVVPCAASCRGSEPLGLQLPAAPADSHSVLQPLLLLVLPCLQR